MEGIWGGGGVLDDRNPGVTDNSPEDSIDWQEWGTQRGHCGVWSGPLECVPPKVLRPDALFHVPMSQRCAHLLGRGAIVAAVLSSLPCKSQCECVEGEDEGGEGNERGGGIMGRKGGGGREKTGGGRKGS
jgi:hypothetical protein